MVRWLLVFGLIISILFDAVQLWVAKPNWALLGISAIVLLISVLGLIVTLANEEEPPELRWAVLYTFPMALLVLASVVGKDELINRKLAEHKIGFTVPSVLPGTRQDYIDAFCSHFASLSIPAMTVVAGVLITWAVQWWERRGKRGAP